MAEIPAETLTRMKAWWAGLEGGTQAMFEAIYLDAPQAVSRVVSGGTWEADGPEPGLAAQLGTDDALGGVDRIPMVLVDGLPDVRPFHAGVGQAVDISWTESNHSQADLPAYVTDVYVSDESGTNVGSVRLDNAALAAGAQAQRTWQFAGSATTGMHTVAIYANAEGSDAGSGVPGLQGYRGYSANRFEVGAGEQQADIQDFQAWSQGTGLLMTLAMDRTPEERMQHIVEAVNWLASYDRLTEEEATALGEVGEWARRTAARIEQNGDEDEALLPQGKVLALADTAQNAGSPDDRSRQRLIAALKTLEA